MGNGLDRVRSAHSPSCSMRSRRQGSDLSLALYNKTGSVHGSGNHTKHIFTRGCCALSVNDQFPSFMDFLPGKIVVVLYHFQWFSPELDGYFFMDHMMTGR